MLDRKIKNKLEEELEVPELVKERVKFTLNDIRLEKFGKAEENVVAIQDIATRKKKEKRIFTKGVAAAACVFLISSITVTAAVTKWTPDFMLRFQMSENEQVKLGEEGVSYTPLETIEKDGMAITLEQCMTDNEYFYCLFKVNVPEGATDGEFEDIVVEGYKPEDYIEYDTYCARTVEESGDNVFYYVLSGRHTTLEQTKEGEFTADMVVNESCVTEEDYKTGHMTFRFENFGVYDVQNEFQPYVAADWEFQWAEKVVEDKKEYTVNQKVGKGYYARSNAILKTVTISPIVITLNYELPDCPDDKNNLIYYPATPTQVELQDGTRADLTQISSGFEDASNKANKNYQYAYALYPVQETDQIVAIYFGENERLELK